MLDMNGFSGLVNSNISISLQPTCFFYQIPGLVITEKVSCPPGFYCPFLRPDLGNLTLPEMCPPSSECLISRLSSLPCPNVNNSFGAQGRHEPVVCPKKYYCPDPLRISICPKGYFCPTGTVTPRPCDFLSYCPEGRVAQRSLNGIALFIIFDIIILLLYYFKSQQDKAEILKAAARIDKDSALNETVKLNLEQNFIRSMNGQKLRLEFTMEHVGYKLPKGREILQDVTGSIRAARLTAIMGPSGAGKTTFLNVLSGKLEKSFGNLLISGKEVALGKFKKICGFVPQEDVMCCEMTVREIIVHSARMRLPSTWKPSEIEHHADVIIETLNLAHVAHSIIGDGIQRGISGGQRKRVNIGIELAATPICLCLDEPTSGLDSTAALEVVENLRRIARLGMTITAVIHQPRVEIFRKFDDVLLMCPGGKTAYIGPTRLSKPYFGAIGYQFEDGSNEADILMDILSGQGKNKNQNYTPDELVKLWQDHGSAILSKLSSKNPEVFDDLFYNDENPASSKATPSSREEEMASKPQDFHASITSMVETRGASFIDQLFYVHNFSLMQQYRTINYLLLELFVGGAAGGVMGTALLSVDEQYLGVLVPPFTLLSSAPQYGLILQFILLVAMAAGLAAASPGVHVFSEEIEVYWRNASSGHSPLAYFLGKTLSTFYRILLASLHFASVLYFLGAIVVPFPVLFIIILGMYFGVYGLCHTVSMMIKRDSATLLALVLSLFSASFCGYGIHINDAKDWHIYPLWLVQFNMWGSEAFFSSVLSIYDHVYDSDVSNAVFGYTLNRLPTDFIMMFVIGIMWRVIAYICMISFNREKQR